MSISIEKLDCKQFSKYLLRSGYCKSIAAAFLNHKICCRSFLELTDADLRDILPLVGDRIHMRKLLLNLKVKIYTNCIEFISCLIQVRNTISTDARAKFEATPDRHDTVKGRQISWSFLEEVSNKLVVIQKEHRDMEKKAKIKATLQGKDLEYINNLQWYDCH